MNKQNEKIYGSLMSRIAIAMMINQGALLVLATALGYAETLFIKIFNNSLLLDAIFRTGECAVYFASFTIPVVIFNFMNKNADREIYEPLESEKASVFKSLVIFFIGLGAITLTAYVNFYLVNIFGDYSDFTQEYFWNVELDYTYQVVIYFIYAAIIPAVVEELLFRKTVCGALTVYGKTTAVIISAVLFALMHANIEQLLYTFVAGLFLGWLYVESKNIIYPILLHFINNGISALGDIIYEKCSPSVYNGYSSTTELVIWVAMGIALLVFLIDILKSKSFIHPLRLKPDENGEEVAPLTMSERMRGFFSPAMVIFIIYSVATMIFYVFLSTQLG